MSQLNRSRRQLLNSTNAYVPVNPEVSAWVGLIYFLSTGSVDNNTMFAVDNFVSACKAAQIWSQMLIVNPFAISPLNNFEQNRRMALTPLLSPLFVNPVPEVPWQSSGGTPLLSSAGYCPNGNFYVNIGIPFNTAFPNSASVGMSLYFVSGSNNSGMLAGAAPGFTDLFFIQLPATATSSMAYSNIILANDISSPPMTNPTASISTAGFYSHSRVSSSISHSTYRGNSTGFFVGSASVAGTAATSTITSNLTVFQLQSQLNANWYCPTTFMSFLAFHQGLTQGQTQQLFNAVQAMRQQMGGGFA